MTNRSKTLYTGITSNLSKRVFQHKNGTFPGFTSRYQIDRLVYYERFVHVGDAIRREKQIKELLRMKKIALIVSLNPEWKDLSEGWYDQYRPVPAARNAYILPPRIRLANPPAQDDIAEEARSTTDASSASDVILRADSVLPRKTESSEGSTHSRRAENKRS